MAGTVFEMNGTTLTAKPEGELDSMTSPIFEEELRAHLAGAESVTEEHVAEASAYRELDRNYWN